MHGITVHIDLKYYNQSPLNQCNWKHNVDATDVNEINNSLNVFFWNGTEWFCCRYK